MLYSLSDCKPGDVICVNTGNTLPDEAIRLDEALENEPNLDNHVALFHHLDANGDPWGLEARPGGVGWVVLNKYDNPYLVHNGAQPKTDAQRSFICDNAALLLRTPYDWGAIGTDACIALLHRNVIWGMKDFGPEPPAHVVCSSYAVWLYHHAGLVFPNQHGERWTTPADWTEWILTEGWNK